MTIASAVTLFAALCAMAALPSSSVALVVTRSALFGTGSGFAVVAGIVLGDLVLMGMAITGMAALASQIGVLFSAIQYAAAVYLIWFGIQLLRNGRTESSGPIVETSDKSGRHWPASFGAGFLLTLGDIKAIVFYASLLPAFVDLASLSLAGGLTIAAITIVAVGLVKAVYALVACRIAAASRNLAVSRHARRGTGGFFVVAGGCLLLRH